MNIQKNVRPISGSFRILLATVSILVASAVAVVPGLADPTLTESADSIAAQGSAQLMDTATRDDSRLPQSAVYGDAASAALLLKGKAERVSDDLLHRHDQSRELGADQELGSDQWMVPPSD